MKGDTLIARQIEMKAAAASHLRVRADIKEHQIETGRVVDHQIAAEYAIAFRARAAVLDAEIAALTTEAA